MNIKVLIDMNLSPEWVGVFEQGGFPALHWSEIGDPKADDRIMLSWAAQHDYVVFTQDLDFSAILAATRAAAPSVIQLRSQDVLPDRFANTVIAAIQQFEQLLRRGALIVIDLKRSRARILPLIQSQN